MSKSVDCTSSNNQGFLKARIWHSLDFTIGSAGVPRKDPGKSATRFRQDAIWNGYQWQEFLDIETDQAAIQRLLSRFPGSLASEQAGELFAAYEREYLACLEMGDQAGADRAFEKILRLVQGDRSPMGLSAPSISHSSGNNQGLDENSQENQGSQVRVRRGTHGITPYGKRMTRSAGVLLEDKYGRGNLTLGTCTLPALTEEELERVCLGWSELVRQFFQELQRMLVRKGLSQEYVYVSEIQEKRFQQWGQICPHLHWVVQGRVNQRESWRITPQEIRVLWERLLSNVLGRSVDGQAATRIENPRKSLAAELGKYLTKGGKVVKAILQAGKGSLLPTAWWGASAVLKQEVKRRLIQLTGEMATYLDRHLEELRAAGKVWFTRIYHEFVDPVSGQRREVQVGTVGRFTSRAALNELLEGVSLAA